MNVFLLFSAFAAVLPTTNAATRVAVVELGKRGSVQRTDSRDPLTTVAGVVSFWSALHSPGRKLQHAGMTVVPDLFKKGGDGLVLGMKGNGVDVDSMPFVSSLLSDEGINGIVGHFEVFGKSADALLKKVRDADSVDASVFASSCKRHAKSPGLTGMMANVEVTDSVSIDGQLRDFVLSMDQEAADAGKTIILHLVVEEEEGQSARRRLLARRLEDEEEEDEENEDEDGNNADGQQNNFYGYGYYNSYGEWVTPYKTMFQIQYFNVVLWTAIGLTVILFFTIYLMMYMPLMPDTLLFGESAKLVGDD